LEWEPHLRIFFNKPQNRLSLGEGALFAAIPNSPTSLPPALHPENTQQERGKVLQLMMTDRRITDGEHHEPISKPIPTERFTALTIRNVPQDVVGYRTEY